MGSIEKIMQNLCDAMYPLPSAWGKTFGFFHFLGHIKEKRKILISPEMHKKRKISFTLRLYVFWSQHKITFCENYFHCRCGIHYDVCLNVEVFKHKLHKTTLTRNYHGRRIAHLGTNASLKCLIVKLLSSFKSIAHLDTTWKVILNHFLS